LSEVFRTPRRVEFADTDVAGIVHFSIIFRFLEAAESMAVEVERVGTKTIAYGFEFRRNGNLVAKGEVTSRCCRVLPDHRLEGIEIPEGIRQLLSGPD
jgi:acyl-CoA thioesterase FadM